MSEIPSPNEQIEALQTQYGDHLTRGDDWDLATRALLLSSAVLSVAEVGIVAFSQSTRKRIAGALAPIVAVGLSQWADQKYLTSRQDAVAVGQNAIEIAKANELPTPEWALVPIAVE